MAAAGGRTGTVPQPLEPTKSWILGEPPENYEDEVMAKLVPSPEMTVGATIEPRQRVLKICLGAEHGILLTDAGIACTWGDNRYGQLGRRPCRKEEDDQPFPVLDLQNEEIAQVAAGRHHCLALTAKGEVWAWGRNKAGQLGCGDNRDKVYPSRVSHWDENEAREMPLGSGSDKERIITIGAGGNSSVAASMGSDVWQWGEISEQFKRRDKDSAKKDGRGRSGGHQEVQLHKVSRNRPHKVFEDGMYRSGLRQEVVSISQLGCRVLSGSDDKNRLRDIVESLRQLQDVINRERSEIAEEDKEFQSRREQRLKNGGEGDGNEQRNLQETLAMLQLDIDTCDREIDILRKNQKSCEDQQVHNREQINSLMNQQTRLSDEKDDMSQKVLLASKGSADRKQKEERLAEIKEYVEANQNTRMTLLDQLAATDKEKQKYSSKLEQQLTRKTTLKRRLDTVRDLGSHTSDTGSSDLAMKFLKENKEEIHRHFEGRQAESDFVEAKEALERDRKFLDGIEFKMKEMVANTTLANRGRAEKVQKMLQDIVQLRRSWMDLQEDKWMPDDLNLDVFFERPRTYDMLSSVQPDLSFSPQSRV